MRVFFGSYDKIAGSLLLAATVSLAPITMSFAAEPASTEEATTPTWSTPENRQKVTQEVASFIADAKLAVPITYEKYTPSLSVDWGMEILFAPSRARDRRLLYAYPVSEIEWQKLAEITGEGGAPAEFAIVNRLSGDAFAGEDVFTGTIITASQQNVSEMASYFANVANAKEGHVIEATLSNVVPYAALVNSGSYLNTDQVLSLENSSVPYIASSQQLPIGADPVPILTKSPREFNWR